MVYHIHGKGHLRSYNWHAWCFPDLIILNIHGHILPAQLIVHAPCICRMVMCTQGQLDLPQPFRPLWPCQQRTAHYLLIVDDPAISVDTANFSMRVHAMGQLWWIQLKTLGAFEEDIEVVMDVMMQAGCCA